MKLSQLSAMNNLVIFSFNPACCIYMAILPLYFATLNNEFQPFNCFYEKIFVAHHQVVARLIEYVSFWLVKESLITFDKICRIC